MLEIPKCRALLDSGTVSTYISERIGKRPIRKETRQVDMMMNTTSKKIEIHNVQVRSITNDFEMTATVSKVDKAVLLSLPNPQYEQIIKHHKHPKEVKMDNKERKPELPMHIILGASEYAKIKMETKSNRGTSGRANCFGLDHNVTRKGS